MSLAERKSAKIWERIKQSALCNTTLAITTFSLIATVTVG